MKKQNDEIYVARNTAKYGLINEVDKIMCRNKNIPTEFEAYSIGSDKRQLAIIPMDDATKEDAELLCKLWNDYHELNPKKEPEELVFYRYTYKREERVRRPFDIKHVTEISYSQSLWTTSQIPSVSRFGEIVKVETKMVKI